MRPSAHLLLHLIPIIGLAPAAPARAQVLSHAIDQRGNGSVQTCDNSLQVDFSTNYLDGYSCQFLPVVIPGDHVIIGSTWYSYDDPVWEMATGSPTVPYMGPAPYPICYTVDAVNETTLQPCSATVCKVVTPIAFQECASLTADFTISAVQGGSITFLNTSQFPGGQIGYAYWDFGDGSSLAASTPTHAFTGSGPYQICLTVVGAPPTSCTATRCQWLYLGPGDVPCSELVSHGFETLTYGSLVGVLDTSRTSGMSAQVDWDFGDGVTGTGTIAVHAYAWSQEYDVCGTLRVWGPLLSDTCTTTVCRSVWPNAVGMGESGGDARAWVWPTAFNDAVSVRSSLSAPARLTVVDGRGRTFHQQSLNPSSEPHLVSLSALPAGCYTIVVQEPAGVRSNRIVKLP